MRQEKVLRHKAFELPKRYGRLVRLRHFMIDKWQISIFTEFGEAVNDASLW